MNFTKNIDLAYSFFELMQLSHDGIGLLTGKRENGRDEVIRLTLLKANNIILIEGSSFFSKQATIKEFNDNVKEDTSILVLNDAECLTNDTLLKVIQLANDKKISVVLSGNDNKILLRLKKNRLLLNKLVAYLPLAKDESYDEKLDFEFLFNTKNQIVKMAQYLKIAYRTDNDL